MLLQSILRSMSAALIECPAWLHANLWMTSVYRLWLYPGNPTDRMALPRRYNTVHVTLIDKRASGGPTAHARPSRPLPLTLNPVHPWCPLNPSVVFNNDSWKDDWAVSEDGVCACSGRVWGLWPWAHARLLWARMLVAGACAVGTCACCGCV